MSTPETEINTEPATDPLVALLAEGRHLHANVLNHHSVATTLPEWEARVSENLEPDAREFFMGNLEHYYLGGQKVPLDHPLSRIHTRTLRLRRIIEKSERIAGLRK
jgi:hypothetical protein